MWVLNWGWQIVARVSEFDIQQKCPSCTCGRAFNYSTFSHWTQTGQQHLSSHCPSKQLRLTLPYLTLLEQSITSNDWQKIGEMSWRKGPSFPDVEKNEPIQLNFAIQSSGPQIFLCIRNTRKACYWVASPEFSRSVVGPENLHFKHFEICHSKCHWNKF